MGKISVQLQPTFYGQSYNVFKSLLKQHSYFCAPAFSRDIYESIGNILMKIFIIKIRMLIQKIFCSIMLPILSWTWVQIQFERKFFIYLHLGFHKIFIESIWAIHTTNFLRNIKMKILLQKIFWPIVLPNIILKVSFCPKLAEDFFI